MTTVKLVKRYDHHVYDINSSSFEKNTGEIRFHKFRDSEDDVFEFIREELCHLRQIRLISTLQFNVLRLCLDGEYPLKSNPVTGYCEDRFGKLCLRTDLVISPELEEQHNLLLVRLYILTRDAFLESNGVEVEGASIRIKDGIHVFLAYLVVS